MRTNWVAMGAGVLLAATLAVAGPHLGQLAPVDPYAMDDADYDIIRAADGTVLFSQSCRSGPVGSWRDRRPWWQRQWEWLVPPPRPERLTGGIM